jgi:hypothetical protein
MPPQSQFIDDQGGEKSDGDLSSGHVKGEIAAASATCPNRSGNA